MLPFLGAKKKQDGGSAATVRINDEGKINASSSEDMGLASAAEDLCRGIENKDHKAIANALRAAFQILDSEPHEEGEHTNE